jgi:hypothetical protein
MKARDASILSSKSGKPPHRSFHPASETLIPFCGDTPTAENAQSIETAQLTTNVEDSAGTS